MYFALLCLKSCLVAADILPPPPRRVYSHQLEITSVTSSEKPSHATVEPKRKSISFLSPAPSPVLPAPPNPSSNGHSLSDPLSFVLPLPDPSDSASNGVGHHEKESLQTKEDEHDLPKNSSSKSMTTPRECSNTNDSYKPLELCPPKPTTDSSSWSESVPVSMTTTNPMSPLKKNQITIYVNSPIKQKSISSVTKPLFPPDANPVLNTNEDDDDELESMIKSIKSDTRQHFKSIDEKKKDPLSIPEPPSEPHSNLSNSIQIIVSKQQEIQQQHDTPEQQPSNHPNPSPENSLLLLSHRVDPLLSPSHEAPSHSPDSLKSVPRLSSNDIAKTKDPQDSILSLPLLSQTTGVSLFRHSNDSKSINSQHIHPLTLSSKASSTNHDSTLESTLSPIKPKTYSSMVSPQHVLIPPATKLCKPTVRQEEKTSLMSLKCDSTLESSLSIASGPILIPPPTTPEKKAFIPSCSDNNTTVSHEANLSIQSEILNEILDSSIKEQSTEKSTLSKESVHDISYIESSLILNDSTLPKENEEHEPPADPDALMKDIPPIHEESTTTAISIKKNSPPPLLEQSTKRVLLSSDSPKRTKSTTADVEASHEDVKYILSHSSPSLDTLFCLQLPRT